MSGHAARFLLLISTLVVVVKSDEACDIDVENTLKTLLSPNPTLQEQALRRDLLRRLQEALDQEKRSLSSLAHWNNLPGKRNLEALARAGLVRTLPFENDDDPDKRSVANLAKNGQLPNSNKDAKRGIESLARNGELHARRDLQDLLEELYDKRNIGSLARNYNLPSYGKRRNGGRSKRQIGYGDEMGEYPLPVYQNQNGDDYEELLKALTGVYPNTDKRFLGSVARSGWFRPTSRFLTPDKRHIGSLARLGWLPSFRNVRRFNRSGRSTDSCRPTTSDGQAEDDSISENAISLEDKRFLLQPAVDQLLLKKILHPRTHPFLSDLS